MPVHRIGGVNVEVLPRSVNLFIYRRQGIDIYVAPERKWWCLWTCLRPSRTAESMQASIFLEGLGGSAEARTDCRRCGSLRVMGPPFWWFNVPQPYDRVSYALTISLGGETATFPGEILYA